MSSKTLHITNGNALTKYLNDLDVSGEYLTWEEMLCEGPTETDITSENAIEKRKSFFTEFYNVEFDVDKFKSEIEKFNNLDKYAEIILWFEYDLFCHINMVAVINLLRLKNNKLPLFLVCSGRVERSKNLMGLSELNSEQLIRHYNNRMKIEADDVDYASTIWQIYCGKDHNLLKPYIVSGSSFKYMSNCLKAHLERFPDSVNGLNVIERNILEIVRDQNIKSKHHLLGYALNYQGYYGYGDLQIKRLMDKLSVFFIEDDKTLRINRKGHEALHNQLNVSYDIKNNMVFGGVKKYDFHFSKDLNKLVKTVQSDL